MNEVYKGATILVVVSLLITLTYVWAKYGRNNQD